MDPLTAYHSRRDSWTGRQTSIDNTLNTLICGMKHVNNVVEHTKEQQILLQKWYLFRKDTYN